MQAPESGDVTRLLRRLDEGPLPVLDSDDIVSLEAEGAFDRSTDRVVVFGDEHPRGHAGQRTGGW